jgi:hypothetical protein
VWAKIVITSSAASLLSGREMQIKTERPGDGHVDNFTLRLHGGRYAWSNMLGHSACVEATVQLLPGAGAPAGPAVRSPCV